MNRFLVLFLCGMLPFFVIAAIADPQKPAQPQAFGGRPEMNGYSLRNYPNFQRDWHFVTVRYRKDTDEMRLTYANDIAWKALTEGGGTRYPDGAVFAKIGLITQEDPDFRSSAVPSGAKRFQLMVKDSRKHAETGGWGFALFDANGLTFDDDPKIQTPACYACHQIVPHRDYVFSQPMSLDIGNIGFLEATLRVPKLIGRALVFETKPAKELPQKARSMLPREFKKVRMLQGSLREHLFQGTLDEIRPALIHEAKTSGVAAALVNHEGTRFSLIYPMGEDVRCKANFGAIFTERPAGMRGRDFPVKSVKLCDPSPP